VPRGHRASKKEEPKPLPSKTKKQGGPLVRWSGKGKRSPSLAGALGNQKCTPKTNRRVAVTFSAREGKKERADGTGDRTRQPREALNHRLSQTIKQSALHGVFGCDPGVEKTTAPNARVGGSPKETAERG